MEYEKRCKSDGYSDKWHKPKCWDDIQKEIKPNDHIDLIRSGSLKSGRVHVSKLLLDPYIDCFEDELFRTTTSKDTDNLSRLFRAIQCLLNPNKIGSRPLLEVDLSQWANICKNLVLHQKLAEKARCKKYGHDISDYTGIDSWSLSTCSVCLEAYIQGPFYSCKYCSLTIHQKCAEGYGTVSKHLVQNLLSYKFVYRFPEYQRCVSCHEERKDFSQSCEKCLFQTHLRYGLLPTVIYHKVHEAHFLSISLLPLDKIHSPRCAACGFPICGLVYDCKMCNVAYHLCCLMLPEETMIKHVGYNHTMKLVYPNMEDEEYQEDFICHVCFKERNPLLWYYYCVECDYFAQLHCIDFISCSTSQEDMLGPAPSAHEMTARFVHFDFSYSTTD